MSRSALPSLALLLVPVLALTACGQPDDRGDDGPPASAGAGYPRTIDNCGHDVTLDAPPQRAVSLNQGTTEILLSLGLEDRLVGTATWTDPVMEGLEEANEGIPRLAENNPSLERVLEAEPDFVTASFVSTLGTGGVATREQFEELGVPAYVSPTDCGAGRAWLPALGDCSVEPVPGGWLVRLLDDDPTATFDERTQVRLDLRSSQARIDVNSASGAWGHPLSPRHAELLFLLAVHPGGCTAGQLAAEVFGDERRTVTVRAEMSRLRRNLGCLLSRRPYRFSENVEVEVLRPDDPGSLLPHSTAPAVRGG